MQSSKLSGDEDDVCHSLRVPRGGFLAIGASWIPCQIALVEDVDDRPMALASSILGSQDLNDHEEQLGSLFQPLRMIDESPPDATQSLAMTPALGRVQHLLDALQFLDDVGVPETVQDIINSYFARRNDPFVMEMPATNYRPHVPVALTLIDPTLNPKTKFDSNYILNSLESLNKVKTHTLISYSIVGLATSDICFLRDLPAGRSKKISVLFVLINLSVREILLAVDQVKDHLNGVKTLVVQHSKDASETAFVFNLEGLDDKIAVIKKTLTTLPLEQFKDGDGMCAYLDFIMNDKEQCHLQEAFVGIDDISVEIIQRFVSLPIIWRHSCSNELALELSDRIRLMNDELEWLCRICFLDLTDPMTDIDLEKFPNLRGLFASSKIVCKPGFRHMALTLLSWQCQTSNETVQIATHAMPYLQSLEISSCGHRNVTGIVHLAHCDRLLSLALVGFEDGFIVNFGSSFIYLDVLIIKQYLGAIINSENIYLDRFESVGEMDETLFKQFSSLALSTSKRVFPGQVSDDSPDLLKNISNLEYSIFDQNYDYDTLHRSNYIRSFSSDIKPMEGSPLEGIFFVLNSLDLRGCTQCFNAENFPLLTQLKLLQCVVSFEGCFQALTSLVMKDGQLTRGKLGRPAHVHAPVLLTLEIDNIHSVDHDFYIDGESCPKLLQFFWSGDMFSNLPFDIQRTNQRLFEDLKDLSLYRQSDVVSTASPLMNILPIDRVQCLEVRGFQCIDRLMESVLQARFVRLYTIGAAPRGSKRRAKRRLKTRESVKQMINNLPKNALLMLDNVIVRDANGHVHIPETRMEIHSSSTITENVTEEKDVQDDDDDDDEKQQKKNRNEELRPLSTRVRLGTSTRPLMSPFRQLVRWNAPSALSSAVHSPLTLWDRQDENSLGGDIGTFDFSYDDSDDGGQGQNE